MIQTVEVKVRLSCRGLRAWHAPKEMHGTWDALRTPTALTTRAKWVRSLNDKKRGLEAIRDSDQLIVVQGHLGKPRLR
jgi:hypothetical protein